MCYLFPSFKRALATKGLRPELCLQPKFSQWTKFALIGEESTRNVAAAQSIYMKPSMMMIGSGGSHRLFCMASRNARGSSDRALNPFPSTYRDMPRPSKWFRPAPDIDDSSDIDLTWFGSPLPAETLVFYNDGDEAEEHGDEGEATSDDKVNMPHRHLPFHDSALIYTAEGYTPEPYYGPLEVQQAPDGRKWSLVTINVIEESQLVLISGEPLAYAYAYASAKGLSGSFLRNEMAKNMGRDLRELIHSQDKWALSLLNPSKPLLHLSADKMKSDIQFPMLDEFLKPSSRSSNIVRADQQQSVNPPGRRKYSALLGKTAKKENREIDYLKVALDNSLFGLYHDPASSCCRGEGLSPFAALWPEVSLIQHSCWPNSSLVVVGSGPDARAVIRATRTILPGESISISHISTLDLLSPLPVRQKTISRSLGFVCSCDRCKAEESEAHFLSPALQSIHEAAVSIRKQLASTIEDPSALRMESEGSVSISDGDLIVMACELVMDDAVALLQAYQEEMSQLNEGTMKGISSWILAGAYPIYEMMAACSQHIGGYGFVGQVKALQGCLECLDVARGSEVHTIISAVLVKMLGSKNGSHHPSTRNALRLCTASHTLRYGSLAGTSMAQLSSASMSCYSILFDSSLVRISVEPRHSEHGQEEFMLKGDGGEDPSIEDTSDSPTDSWGIPITRP
jgi:hypothetical protein